MAVAPAFQAEVVVGADSGEHGEFFTSEPGEASPAVRNDPCLCWRNQVSACSKVAPKGVRAFLFETDRDPGNVEERGPR